MGEQTYIIVEAGPSWLEDWIDFCQEVYSVYYVRKEHGITKELFSKQVFADSGFKTYVQDYFSQRNIQRAWLAIGLDQRIVGSLIAKIHEGYCELKGFYVAPDLKGKGIGHALYSKALVFAGKLPMQLDVVNDMADTIAMYEHWGFEIDRSKGYILYPWIGWSDEARYANRGIYMVKPSKE